MSAATELASWEATKKSKEETLVQQEEDEGSGMNDRIFGLELGRSISPQEDAPIPTHQSATHIPHLICKSV